MNVCIFWSHALAWWIDRELADPAEEACDDLGHADLQHAADLSVSSGYILIDNSGTMRGKHALSLREYKVWLR
jgi:hypothetical protein